MAVYDKAKDPTGFCVGHFNFMGFSLLKCCAAKDERRSRQPRGSRHSKLGIRTVTNCSLFRAWCK